MLALLALICFILALAHVSLGSIDLTILGLAFMAAHLFVASAGYPIWPGRP